MAASHGSNPRASLLSGLRTGGVRSASQPVPHTAAPGGSFNIPRFNPAPQYLPGFPEEVDELGDMMQQNLYLNQGINRYQAPMTAAVDGTNNSFAQQQFGHGGMPYQAGYGMGNNMQAQALQMQMMQMEMLRLQALQAQQYQAEINARQQGNHGVRRGTFNPPATAGPINTSFDLRSATLHSQMQRAHGGADDQVPMTAALGGRFGSRAGGRTSPDEDDLPPPTPTRVISGGTSLGAPLSAGVSATPSKSEAAGSWRRNGSNSVLAGRLSLRTADASGAKGAPAAADRVSPPLVTPARTKPAPKPLDFSVPTRVAIPAVTVIDENGDVDDSSSNGSSESAKSSPVTSTSSCGDQPPLSPREEAAKKLYEGLGLGRPVQAATPTPQRISSVPSRQPRGPPLADELGSKNFATRLRRKAVDGLGALVAARERREIVAF